MNKWLDRFPGRWWTVVWASLVLSAIWGQPQVSAQSSWTVPPVAPSLQNANFECGDSYLPGLNPSGSATLIPNGWTILYRNGSPIVTSTRLHFGKVCDQNDRAFIERLDLFDSLAIISEDIETPPAPGKPFDVVLYQQRPATVGGIYSLSGWMVSLCGSKSKPFDCPDGVYMAKAVGLDPTGGTDPDASSVVWEENRINFVERDANGKWRATGWQNLRTAVRALSPTITIFVRMTSPAQWHGNLGFVDAFSLVRGPLSTLTLPDQVEGYELDVTWVGEQSPDVREIPGSTHRLLFDVQARHGDGDPWRDLVTGAVDPGSVAFTANCVNTNYEFRVRARSEQPPAPPEGARPNHRYPGVWSEPIKVYFAAPTYNATGRTQRGEVELFIPQIIHSEGC